MVSAPSLDHPGWWPEMGLGRIATCHPECRTARMSVTKRADSPRVGLDLLIHRLELPGGAAIPGRLLSFPGGRDLNSRILK